MNNGSEMHPRTMIVKQFMNNDIEIHPWKITMKQSMNDDNQSIREQ